MGLTKKILLFTALLTVGIVAVTLAFTTVQANALAQANLTEKLTSSRDAWAAFQSCSPCSSTARLRFMSAAVYS